MAEWSAWQASRVEVAQQEAEARDIAGAVVERLVQDTEVDPAD